MAQQLATYHLKGFFDPAGWVAHSHHGAAGGRYVHLDVGLGTRGDERCIVVYAAKAG
jgi:hypothetical protein